jgi:hypothetical protein
MLFGIAADLVLVVHLVFILFVVLGGWLVLRRPWVAWLHLPAALWGAIIELTGGICPLTPLENRLQVASGSAGYDGSFVERYLIPVIYPAAINRTVQITLGLVVILVNAIFYGALIRRWLRSR